MISVSCSVVSDSLQPHEPQPTRLLCPWDSAGKNTGVGCHFLLQCSFLTGIDPDAGKDSRQEEKEMTEDKMVGWHHRLNGHEFEQAMGVGDRQGSLGCYSPWGHKEKVQPHSTLVSRRDLYCKNRDSFRLNLKSHCVSENKFFFGNLSGRGQPGRNT